MFKRTKCSIELELKLYYSNLKLEKLIDELEDLLENIDDLREDFSRKKRDFVRNAGEYLELYQSYTNFLTTMPPLPQPLSSLPEFSPFKTALKTTKIPQQNYDEFERECKVRNEIMDEYRQDFMNQIIAVDLACISLNNAKSHMNEIRQKINILINSF
jgi:hypothetical protein